MFTFKVHMVVHIKNKTFTALLSRVHTFISKTPQTFFESF